MADKKKTETAPAEYEVVQSFNYDGLRYRVGDDSPVLIVKESQFRKKEWAELLESKSVKPATKRALTEAEAQKVAAEAETEPQSELPAIESSFETSETETITTNGDAAADSSGA